MLSGMGTRRALERELGPALSRRMNDKNKRILDDNQSDYGQYQVEFHHGVF